MSDNANRYAIANNGDVIDRHSDERVCVGKYYDLAGRIAELEAENARLLESVSSLHVVAGKVAQSGGDSLTQMARDWQAEVERLRAMLPSAEVRADIREWANATTNMRAALVREWLDSLESEST